MTQTELIEAVEKTAETIDGTVYRDYSGRGMMGKLCFGIVCIDPTHCIEVAAINGLRGARQDNMGRDYIVYWPHVKPF